LKNLQNILSNPDQGSDFGKNTPAIRFKTRIISVFHLLIADFGFPCFFIA